MKLIHLDDETPEDLTSQFTDAITKLNPSQKPNKYGEFLYFAEAVHLITHGHVDDYTVWRNDRGKFVMSIRGDKVIKAAIRDAQTRLTALDSRLHFKQLAETDNFYLPVNDNLADKIPPEQRLLLTIRVFGVFLQTSTNMAFLQCCLKDVAAYPLIDLCAIYEEHMKRKMAAMSGVADKQVQLDDADDAAMIVAVEAAEVTSELAMPPAMKRQRW